MPELPEVETVRRGLAPAMEGARIERLELRRPDLRFPFPPGLETAVEGRTITSVGRRAKFLLIGLADAPGLICHLGMSGSFRIESDEVQASPGAFRHARSKQASHDHVVFHLVRADAGRLRVVFNDPRRFGFLLPTDDPLAVAMLARLGVEPVGNLFGPDLLADLLRGKATPLKAALLDQKLIAGLGNIYASEALWRAGLLPTRRAGSIVPRGKRPGAGTERLAEAIRSVLADAISAGGSSLRDHRQTDGNLGYFQHSFSVYDRDGQPCLRDGCGGHIRSIVQSGRTTYYCPRCQR